MAENKLSDRSLTADLTGAEVHVIKPTATPGIYTSERTKIVTIIGATSSSPIIKSNKTGSNIESITANSFLAQIGLKKVSGTPTVRIGITPAGSEVMESTSITDYLITKTDMYFAGTLPIYIVVSGGYINYRLDLTRNYM